MNREQQQGDEQLGKDLPLRSVVRNGAGGVTGYDDKGHMWMSASSTMADLAAFHADDRKPINEQRFFHAVGVCEECQRPKPQLVR